MARMQLALVIGGAVAASVGAAFKTVEGRIQKLEEKGNKAKVLKATIGETMKLQAEWKKAHDTGAAVVAKAPAVAEIAKSDAAPQQAPGAVVRELVKTAPPQEVEEVTFWD